MSVGRRKIDRLTPNQLTLFDRHGHCKASAPAPGSFNIGAALCSALTQALKQCPFSRYEAAARMSELVGTEITKSQIDCWTAESKEYHRFPAEYLPAFCQVTGSREPLRIIAELIQCHLLESDEALLAELGRIDQAKRDLARREKAIREYLAQAGGKPDRA